MKKQGIAGKILSLMALATLTTACSGSGQKLEAVRPTDKYLACNEIKLEMLEAENYRDKSRESTGPSLGNALGGLGYIGTFIQAENNIGNAEKRLDHLGDMYRIKGCSYDSRTGMAVAQNVGGSPYPMAAAGMPVMQAAPQGYYPYPAAPAYQPAPMQGTFQQPAMKPPEIGAGLVR